MRGFYNKLIKKSTNALQSGPGQNQSFELNVTKRTDFFISFKLNLIFLFEGFFNKTIEIKYEGELKSKNIHTNNILCQNLRFLQITVEVKSRDQNKVRKYPIKIKETIKRAEFSL